MVSETIKPLQLVGQAAEFKFKSSLISMELARCCCRPKQHPSLCSVFLSVIGLWGTKWQRNTTACSKSNPVQSSRSKSTTCPTQSEERAIRIEQHSDFRWWRAKAWKRCQAWFWIDGNQSLQPKSVANEMRCLKDVVTSVDRKSFDFRFEFFFEQSAFVNNHLLCYWRSIHNSI